MRHGETPASLGARSPAGRTCRSRTDGEAQAAALRPVLEGERFDGVWSSDLQPALRTARLAYGRAARATRGCAR